MTLPLEPRTVTKYFACIGKRVGYSIDWTFETIDSPTCLSMWASDSVLCLLGTEVHRTFYVGERPVVIHEGHYDPLWRPTKWHSSCWTNRFGERKFSLDYY